MTLTPESTTQLKHSAPLDGSSSSERPHRQQRVTGQQEDKDDVDNNQPEAAPDQQYDVSDWSEEPSSPSERPAKRKRTASTQPTTVSPLGSSPPPPLEKSLLFEQPLPQGSAPQPERPKKRRRVTRKQEKYAIVAAKWPEVAFGLQDATREDEIARTRLPWEMGHNGTPPYQIEPKTWAEDMPRPPPLQLGDLECTRTLGIGGYGEAWAVRVRARPKGHRMDVVGGQMAVKALHKRKFRNMEPADERDFKDRLHDEKNAERGLLRAMPWHAFISGSYDAIADSRNAYLFTELGHCGTLRTILERGPLRPSVARFYFACCLNAIQTLCSAQLVHGDVKPDNFFVGADGYLMLGDFGMTGGVHEGEYLGTTQYCSPELAQRRCGPIERGLGDLWSLGCILYEMGVGKMAFRIRKGHPQGGDLEAREEELRARIIRGQYFWPADAPVDAALKDLVNGMLRYDPNERCVAWAKDQEGNAVPHDRIIALHPFLRGFPWDELDARTLLAPSVPKAIPDLSLGWHHLPLPPQRKMPGLPQVIPLERQEWDNRFIAQRRPA